MSSSSSPTSKRPRAKPPQPSRPQPSAGRGARPVRRPAAPTQQGWAATAWLLLALVVLSAAWVAWVSRQGYTLYYGDAQAHLTIARRILDSRTPGPDQIGTVWLPLPHLLTLPFVANDSLWRSGLAGALPTAGCFVLAGLFLFRAARRALQSTAAGVTAAILFAANPNLLYLQATPMTEPVLFACLLGLLAATVWFAETRSGWAVCGAAAATLAATQTRYEGWFLIPFVLGYLLLTGGERRWRMALLYGAVVSLGPLSWLAHNWWYYGDALAFYWGEYSAKAIYQRALDQGMARYAGDHEWGKAVLYYRTAATMCVGLGLVGVGVGGLLPTLWKRAWWPLVLLSLAPVFYVCSMYSSGTPIFVPTLWPQSYYNTRYGLAVLPLLAFSAAGWVALVPSRWRVWAASAIIFTAIVPWLVYPRAESWVCWKESQVNSVARRAWTSETARYLQSQSPRGGIFTTLGDVSGVYQQAGIPFRRLLQEGNNPAWDMAISRPDLHLREEWAVAVAGDAVALAVRKAARNGRGYRLVKEIVVPGAPPVEIWRRK